MGADSFDHRAGAGGPFRPAAGIPPPGPSAALAAFLQDPSGALLAVPLPFPGDPDVTLCRVALPEMAAAPDAAWEELAAAVLADDERPRWRDLGTTRRRGEWLLGRIAAKDAVRARLGRTGGAFVPPAAIRILPDAWGRPLASGTEPAGPCVMPAISIAHTDGVALGAAADGPDIGVDVERLSRRRGDFERAAFHDDERARLDATTGEARRDRTLRLFCAKEAAAKAVGRGFMGTPLNFRILACDEPVTRATLAPEGRVLAASPHWSGRVVEARLHRDGDLVIALARGAAADRPARGPVESA